MNPDKKYFVYNRMSSLFLKDKNFPHVLEISDKDYSQAKFTKEELAEMLDGALYRLPIIQYNSGRICPKEEIESDTMGKFGQITGYPEWINPLIELVPVEDGE